MIVPVAKTGRFIDHDVKIFTIWSEEQAKEHGIDVEWFQSENLTGKIALPPDTVLLKYYDVLIGAVVEHEKFEKGEVIRTSPIQMIVHTSGEFRNMTIVFTKNSRYEVIAA